MMALSCELQRMPAIVVHGGSGVYSIRLDANTSPDETISKYRKGVCEAAKAGYAVLSQRGSAVDAVEAAAVSMEDDPTFNAGRGSHLTLDYQIEMDAVIMDGSTHNAGAVGCITNVKNPCKVARLVMDKSEHTLFVGAGALRFAESHGIERIPLEDLMTEKAIGRLEANPKWKPSLQTEIYNKSESKLADEHDTVGAVAIDCHGNVAVATTTGGITAKMPGRMGDSAIIGSGGYADNSSGAVSTTGHGESLMKTCVARHAAFLMEQGHSPQAALQKSLDYMKEMTGGVGGAIAVDKSGDIGVYFTAEGMSWASKKNGTLTQGMFKGECFVEEFMPASQ